jgi:hypothetical protein
MKFKRFFSLLLLLACGHTMADWVRVSSNERSVFYLDSSISKKVEGHIMIKMVRDHLSVQVDRSAPYLSSKDELEVDCVGERVRRIYTSDHPQAMGGGKPVYTEHGPMSWNRASPNTIIKRIVEITCARS